MTARPPVFLLAAIAGAMAVLLSLGFWQLQRLEWKRGLIAQVETRLAAPPIAFDDAVARAEAGEAMEYQPVFLDGAYAHEQEAGVFGSHDAKAGIFVFTPLVPAGADGARRVVYVNRGFAPQAMRAPAARADGAVAGPLRVVGLLRRAERKRGVEKWVEPKNQPADNLYFIRDPQALAADRGLETPGWYVDSSGAENPAPWPKGGLTRLDFPNRHLDYALTWFGLAAALAGVSAVFLFRKRAPKSA